MMKFLVFFQIWLTLSVPFLPHPIIMALVVILISLLTSVVIWKMKSLWFGLALSLVFLGGMMMIFLYFTCLTNSEKIFLNFKSEKIIWLIFMFIMFNFFSAWVYKITYMDFEFSNNFQALVFPLNALLVSILLFGLLTVVKLTQSFKGSLESTFTY